VASTNARARATDQDMPAWAAELLAEQGRLREDVERLRELLERQAGAGPRDASDETVLTALAGHFGARSFLCREVYALTAVLPKRPRRS
jgi:hypothetical protein